MSVYISGMDMPMGDMKNIMILSDGRVFQFSGYGNPKPLGTAVHIPKHGRLIDADALEDEAITYYALPVLAVNSIGPEAELVLRLREIDSAPTIIPADPPVMFYPQVPGITPTVISDKEGEG